MPKQVDLSDPNLDLTQLCLREHRGARIYKIIRDNKFDEDSFYAYNVYYKLIGHGENKYMETSAKNGDTYTDPTDIIYKSDFEA